MVHELTMRAWRKSTYSANDVECVEFARSHDDCAVRDSKQPAGPVLTCSPAQWVAFTAAISRGQFG
jgi:hypothetical protein